MDPSTIAKVARKWSVKTPDNVLKSAIASAPAADREEVLEIAEQVIFYEKHDHDMYTSVVKACDMRARMDLVPYVWAQYLYIAKEEL